MYLSVSSILYFVLHTKFRPGKGYARCDQNAARGFVKIFGPLPTLEPGRYIEGGSPYENSSGLQAAEAVINSYFSLLGSEGFHDPFLTLLIIVIVIILIMIDFSVIQNETVFSLLTEMLLKLILKN